MRPDPQVNFVKGTVRDLANAAVCTVFLLFLSGCIGIEHYCDGHVRCIYKRGGVQVPRGIRVIDGFLRCYWPDGELKYTGHFDEDRKVGVHTFYSPKGLIMDQWSYALKKMQFRTWYAPADGTHTAYWPNGVTRLVETYLDGEVEGSTAVWDETGKKLGEGTYLNGMPWNGQHFNFTRPEDARFMLQMMTTYVRGERHGPQWRFGTLGANPNAKELYWWERNELFTRGVPSHVVAAISIDKGDGRNYGTNYLDMTKGEGGTIDASYGSRPGLPKTSGLKAGEKIPGSPLKIKLIDDFMYACEECPE